MSEPYAPADIETKPDSLRHAEDDATRQRAVERTHAADDDRFEGEQQQSWTVRRSDSCFEAMQCPGKHDQHECNAGSQCINMAMVEPHQFGGIAIVTDGTK